MDNRLRKALERRGMPPTASDRDAQDFYAQISLEEKGRLAVQLAVPEVRTPDQEPLHLRSVAETEQLSTRAITLRAQSIDEEARTVEAVIATEKPVQVYDWRRDEVIDEILLISGARIPDQLPMLALHSRWSLDDLLGSAREIRAAEGQIVARLYFAEGDPDADRAWNKARQGHLTDTSVGYRVDPGAVEIQPGNSAMVSGRNFTAAARRLRVVTSWEPKEVSLVPIGADQDAKVREHSSTFKKRGISMDPTVKAYLESIGLRASTTDAEAEQFFAGLAGAERAEADRLKAEADLQVGPQPQVPPPLPLPVRTAQTGDPADAARQAVVDERDRVRQIIELAGQDVPRGLRERAIYEGWAISRASAEFLAAVRTARAPQQQPTGGPGIHTRSHDASLTPRNLAAGLLMAQGLDPTHHRLHNGLHNPLRGDQLTEQDADQGERFQELSAVDICRECALLETGRIPLSRDEAIRTAVSGSALTLIFTTNAYAQLLEGWRTVADTTLGWCDETDEMNFLPREDITVQADARLTQLPRGGTAEDASFSDTHETWKIARYAKRFVVDEQDILDDRLSALMAVPAELGEAARRLRPDLVYSLMIQNPSLVADSTAVFHADHSNLGSGILGADSLKAGITVMSQQRINNNVLNIVPRFLIVPAALKWSAKELTKFEILNKLFATTSDPNYSPINALAQEGIVPVVDDRLGASGVIDPRTGEARTGSATQWFLAAGGRRSIRVAYRTGTNRSPVMRSFTLDKGQWGLGWDINFDIGAAFMDSLGWYMSTGA